MVERNSNARRRVVIERVRPEINCGRFAIKRVVGESVTVEADVFADGHDQLACRVLYWQEGDSQPQSSAMQPLENDRWVGEFRVSKVGRYLYTIEGWVDRFKTWRGDLLKRIAAAQDLRVEFMIGAEIIEHAAEHAPASERNALREWARRLRENANSEAAKSIALEEELLPTIQRYPEPHLVSRYEKELALVVDPPNAQFSAWYEVFPRSCSPEGGRHGTFADCEAWLPYIAGMGFDVVYLPPVHPIGHTFRKGKNNSVTAQPDDVGSPWAIGSEEGGHKSIHPQLGTLQDFRRFVARAKEHGLRVALDIAFQCSPDHPYTREHPEWFRKRPDGTIQYAENPPKKYQDIYPINFETSDPEGLWNELRSVVQFWIDQGVQVFRVDNPHTKAFAFWEWLISGVKQRYPETIFLAEAFTRPHVMQWLAKLGFSQSYTYFTWRNTKQELTDYFKELTQTEVREYLRPNLWPATPDILSEVLQVGGRPAFMVRLVLAAMLGASYGIYGPAFELCENVPFASGSEEYMNSEKYELKHRDLEAPWSLRDFIARVNAIRKENPALHANNTLRFHDTDNPVLLCFSKTTEDMANTIVVVVNLDSFHRQTGWVHLDLESLGVDPNHAFQAHDLLGGGQYLWQGPRNYVELIPGTLPAHVLRIRRWIRTERDFDYYL
ncbi:MAG TPA: alpha-1,4-glucan--maltose-1-phosphate maltosyltransferase [Candidatus Limnocylindrales bacterium]|nr:alpha-1,4-glucan--maltose-1-phosphate maltosyltransferase [Candidatus Limnocylindrales bacterium]